MTTHPDPLVPAEVDLRDFGYMPLDALRLRDSDLAIEASPEVFRASVLLWCASWHQVPAGSLPMKDKTLAEYSRAGVRWPRIRAEVLSRWVECADGRLYHPVVAEKAREAQLAKDAQRARTKAATEAREAKRRLTAKGSDDPPSGGRDGGRDDERHVERDEQRDVERNVVQGKGREGNRREEKEKDTRTAGSTDVAGVPIPPPGVPPTASGLACRAMKAAGISDPNPGNPDLLALIAAGASEAEFIGAAQTAVDKGKGFAYAIGTLKRQRADAAQTAKTLHTGPMPAAPPARQSATDRQIATMNALTGKDRDHDRQRAPAADTIDIAVRVVP